MTTVQDIEGRNGTSVPPVNQESKDFVLLMDVVATVTNLCLGALAFGAFLVASAIINISAQHGAHIILVVFGYVIIISQAVLSLNATSGWGRSLKHHQRRAAHLVLQVIGCTSAISGGIIAIANSNPNAYKSVHGVMGITTMSFTLLTLIGGIFNYVFPDSNVRIVKFIHSILGSVTLTLAFVTVLIALHSALTPGIAWAYTVCAGFGLIGTLLSAARSNVRRLSR